MKKLLSLSFVLLMLVITSCSVPTNTPKTHVHKLCPECNKCTLTDCEESICEGHNQFELDKESKEFYSDLSSLSDRGKEAIELINNMHRYMSDTIDKDESARKYKQKPSRLEELTNAGIEFNKSSYSAKDMTMSTFTQNIINARYMVFGAEKMLKNNEYYYDINGDKATCYMDKHTIEVYDYQITESYQSIFYFVLEYHLQKDEYHYILLSWDSNGNILANESDLKTYFTFYNRYESDGVGIINYIDWTDRENIYNEDGTIKDLSHYGDKEWQHRYMINCQVYDGLDNGYYKEFYTTKAQEVLSKAAKLKESDVTYEQIESATNKLPRINADYYYLTRGYTKDVKGILEIGIRPTRFYDYTTHNSEHYKLLMYTDEMSVVMNPMSFIDNIATLECGINTVTLPFEINNEEVSFEYFIYNKVVEENYYHHNLQYLLEDYPQELEKILEYLTLSTESLLNEYDNILEIINGLNMSEGYLSSLIYTLEGLKLKLEQSENIE